MNRYNKIDTIRGITIISMILYHLMWDIVFVAGHKIDWYTSGLGRIWQKSICITFIFVSGFCFKLSRNNLKRGAIVFLCGVVVTAVTMIAAPNDKIIFGILTCIGSCMLCMIPLDRAFKKANSYLGIVISILFFLITKNINMGYLGFDWLYRIDLPRELYANYFTTYLGFMHKGFSSADYFSVFPWLFLYIAGYYAYLIFKSKDLMRLLEKNVSKPIEWVGRHSLPIYMAHQPIIMLIFYIIQRF